MSTFPMSPAKWLFKPVLALGLPILISACSGGGSAGSSDEPSEQQSLNRDTAFAYVQRSINADAEAGLSNYQSKLQNPNEAPQDLNSPYTFQPGAKLVHRSGLDVNAVEWTVLDDFFGGDEYDVKDVSVSADGERIVFAAHGPEFHPTDYTWNIYEYAFESRTLRRIIEDDTLANAGRDTSPTYTHDGRILFSTDREAGNPNSPVDNIVDDDQEENCYKIGPAEKPSLLHVMSNRGEDILQLTYGNNHDTKTTTLLDGKVAFVRWSRSYELLPQCDGVNVEANGGDYKDIFSSAYPKGLSKPTPWDEQHLCQYAIPTPLGKALPSNHYTLLQIDPDSEQLDQLYNTVTLFGSDEEFVFLNDIVQASDGYLMGVMKHFYNQHQGGNVVSLQSPNQANTNTVFGNVAPRALIANTVDIYPNQLSSGGWYSAVAPYNDGTDRVLMSWSQCATNNNGVSAFCSQGQDGDVVSQYGIWVYDPATDSRLPIVQARKDVVYSDLAIAQSETGAHLPFAPVNENFVDNLDESRIICDDPSDPPPPPGEDDPPPGEDDPPPGEDDPPPGEDDPPPGEDDPPPGEDDPPANQAPVANAGADQNAFVGDTVVFDGSASNDPDAQPNALSFDWYFSELPIESNLGDDDIVGATTATPSFVPDVRGSFVLELKVSDGEDFDTDTVAVLLGNNAPIANAGADQNVAGGLTVQLDGSASYDIDNDQLNYWWTLTDIPPSSTLTDADIIGRDTPNPQFTPDTALELPIKADFVFIIDGSNSMDEEIAVVRQGLSAFVAQLSDPDNDIDARFAVVTFEERPFGTFGPVVQLPFTESTTVADVAADVIAAFDAIDTSSLGGQQREPGLEAIRAVLGDPATVSTPIAGLEFRTDARKNLILATDEDSDGPYNGGDYEPPDSFDGSSSWQAEINQTAAVVIANDAFLDLLVNPGDDPSRSQYGDPAADTTEVDSDRFDPDATLAALQDPATGFPNSLQAQVLSAGLIARSYQVTAANDPVFVDSFFNSKVQEAGDNPLLGYYVLSLMVNDGELDSVADTVSVQAFADNSPPNARAGADQSALVNAQVALNGGNSFDSDDGPNPLTYAWTFVEVPAGSGLTNIDIVNADMASANFTPDVSGTYILELRVSDGGPGTSGYDTDRIIISVSDTETTSNANAGNDITLAACDLVTLDGSSSIDVDGLPQALSFDWTLVSRPDNSGLLPLDVSDANTANPSFTPDRQGSFVFQLKVSDGQSTDTDNVMVSVGDFAERGQACP